MWNNTKEEKENCLYKKEDVVWLPMRQLSTRDQNDTDINSYRSTYDLQQWAKPIPHSQL